MSTKVKILISIITIGGAFASGRYLAPTKVVVETKTVEVEKKTTETKEKKRVKRKTTTKTAPDGSSETTTVEVEHSGTDTSTTDDITKHTDNRSETIRDRNQVTISALAGVNPFNPALPVYGGHITKNLIGPITVGAFGFTNGLIGASVGITF